MHVDVDAAAVIAALVLAAIAGAAAARDFATRRRIGRLVDESGALAGISGRQSLDNPGVRPRRRRSRSVFVIADHNGVAVIPRSSKQTPDAVRVLPYRGLFADWRLVISGASVSPLLRITDASGRHVRVWVAVQPQRALLEKFTSVLRARATLFTQPHMPGWSRWLHRLVPVLVVVPMLASTTTLDWVLPQPGSARITAGYSALRGPGGVPLKPGQPWGRRCVPVVIRPSAGTAPYLLQELATVVSEARAGGLNIVAATPQGLYLVGLLRNVTRAGPIFVPIFPKTGNPPSLPSGKPYRENIGWDATGVGGGYDRLTVLQLDLYERSLGGNRPLIRTMFRYLIAAASGVDSHSNARGTGVANNAEDSTDRFSAQDLTIMRQFSGC